MPELSQAEKLRIIVAGVIEFCLRQPQIFDVMRNVGVPDASSTWDAKRKEAAKLAEQVVIDGTKSGEFNESRPDRIGLYLMAMVRAAMLYGPKIEDQSELTDHITGVLLRGISRNEK